MLNAPLRILIAAALCVAGLLGLVVRETLARGSGVEALLPMEAIDPRALLSGHYVIVAMRESVPPDRGCMTANPEAEWLALAPTGETAANGRVYSLVGAAPTRAEAPTIPDALVVRGAFNCTDPTPANEFGPGAPGWLDLDLGIERFHINQAEAERIQRVLIDQNVGETARVYAVVAIGQDGRARLKGLVVDRARLELGWN